MTIPCILSGAAIAATLASPSLASGPSLGAALSLAAALPLALAAGAGILLGAVYFGGLWLTVRRLPTSRRPALTVVVSLAARVAILLGGTYLVMDGRVERLLACLVGIVVARLILVRLVRPSPALTPARAGPTEQSAE
jgi:F1F0 ATPase subunit 2